MRPKCVWNGVAVSPLSRVEGTRYRCLWGQLPTATLPLSQNQTSALAAPFHSLQFSSDQDNSGAEGGSVSWGAQARRRSNRGQRLRIDGEREEKSLAGNFGSIHKSIRALFSPGPVWVSCNGQSGSDQTLTSYNSALISVKYVGIIKAATI